MSGSRYLLDTHLVYWWMRNDAALGPVSRQLIRGGDIAVSVVSLWELVMKNRKGKLSLPEGPLAHSLEPRAQGRKTPRHERGHQKGHDCHGR